jgi:hypothetical protein
MLYRLLTGDFPYPVDGTWPEVARHILDTPPAPPTRHWRSDSGVASGRRRRSRNGSCPIDGELETILLKAMAKERIGDTRPQTNSVETSAITCAASPSKQSATAPFTLLVKRYGGTADRC